MINLILATSAMVRANELRPGCVDYSMYMSSFIGTSAPARPRGTAASTLAQGRVDRERAAQRGLHVAVVERTADAGLRMARVLDDALAVRHVPQPGGAVGRRRHQVRRVHGEDAVPHPPPVLAQLLLQMEVFERPYLHRLVAGRGGEQPHVGGDEALEEVVARVGVEPVEGLEGGHRRGLAAGVEGWVVALDALLQPPHVARPRVVPRRDHAAVAGDREAANGVAHLGHQLAGPRVRAQVPHADAAVLVPADQLVLVGVQHDGVDARGADELHLAPLRRRQAQVPQLDGAVLGPGEHPLALRVEADGGDVARVRLEGGVGLLPVVADLEQLDVRVARRREERLVRRDLQLVHLRVRVRNGAVADAVERVPEAHRVVVPRGGQHHARLAAHLSLSRARNLLLRPRPRPRPGQRRARLLRLASA
mmetsp:Transcript_13792/g.50235  ORF Transcript_13792/g.50235 Transcript_13792/m.50235 type:complete len:422 (-) Transcript_13792:152-1417(-)